LKVELPLRRKETIVRLPRKWLDFGKKKKKGSNSRGRLRSAKGTRKGEGIDRGGRATLPTRKDGRGSLTKESSLTRTRSVYSNKVKGNMHTTYGSLACIFRRKKKEQRFKKEGKRQNVRENPRKDSDFFLRK